jgi:hypothetical protein
MKSVMDEQRSQPARRRLVTATPVLETARLRSGMILNVNQPEIFCGR